MSIVKFVAWSLASLVILSLPAGLVAQTRRGIPASEIVPILARAQRIHAFWKASGRVFPNQENHVRSQSAPAATPPVTAQACCSTWQGFDFTGLLSVAPTDPTGRACSGCVAGFSGNNAGIPFPDGRAFQGGLWSTFMSFHSTIPGPCTVTFLWFSPPIQQPVQGSQSTLPDCGGNNIWVFEFFNFGVPALPGNAVAVGVIQASNGTTDVDFEQFLIQ